jgi:hypothetical protein
MINRHYSDAEFDQLTPAEKQKLWQLRNAGKTPGTGPTRRDRRRAVALTSISSTSSGSSSKRQMEDPAVKSDQPAEDQGWGRPKNCDNPCLGHQVRPCGDGNQHAKPTNTTSDPTINWSPDLTQTIETLRTIRLQIDQQCIVKDVC